MESAKPVLCLAEFGKEKGCLAAAPHATTLGPCPVAFVPRESDRARRVGDSTGGGADGRGEGAGRARVDLLSGRRHRGEEYVQTSSGQRYDQTAPECAALKWPLGTMLHLVHDRNNIDVTINDHGPYRRGRALDCTPAVDKALHLGGLGSVRVEPYPPLPKARPVKAQALHY